MGEHGEVSAGVRPSVLDSIVEGVREDLAAREAAVDFAEIKRRDRKSVV